MLSPDGDDDSFDLGAGLVGEITEGTEAFVSYRGGFGEDQTDHAAQLGVRMAW